MNTLKGKILIMFSELQTNTTPFQYSTAGIQLGPARCRMLAQNIAYNNSLLSINMARKQIGDIEGVSLAQMLETNGCLRKLELEGNLLGTQSASAFGKALAINKSLRYLDIESNQLTADGALFQGVCDLAESLCHNNTLLSLNLANNMMDAGCAKKFRECIMSNFTLIDFDFSMNDKIELEDSRAIQDYLRRNKAMYDAERLKEWKERKLMRAEDEKLKEL